MNQHAYAIFTAFSDEAKRKTLTAFADDAPNTFRGGTRVGVEIEDDDGNGRVMCPACPVGLCLLHDGKIAPPIDTFGLEPYKEALHRAFGWGRTHPMLTSAFEFYTDWDGDGSIDLAVAMGIDVGR